MDTFNFIINDTGTGSGSVTTEVSLPGLGGVTDTDLTSVFINGVLAMHTVNTPQTDQWSATNVPICIWRTEHAYHQRAYHVARVTTLAPRSSRRTQFRSWRPGP